MLLPTPTFLRGLSPLGQEGFASFGATLSCVLSSVPRLVRLRYQPEFPRTVMPSPSPERLGTKSLDSRGLSDVRYLRPARSLPSPGPGLSVGTAPGFPLRSVYSASCFWLLTRWEFHPLGCTALLVTPRPIPRPILRPTPWAQDKNAQCRTRFRRSRVLDEGSPRHSIPAFLGDLLYFFM